MCVCVCEIHAVSKTLVIPGIGIDSMPMGRDRQLRELSMHVTKKCGEIRNRKSDYSRWCYRSCTLDFWRHSVLYGLMYVNLNRILVWSFCILKTNFESTKLEPIGKVRYYCKFLYNFKTIFEI